MLESKNMTLCGVMKWNEEWRSIYCDEDGMLAVELDDNDTAYCLTEIVLQQPLDVGSVTGLCNNIENGLYGDCIGVIYGYDGTIVVLLDEDYAVERRLWAPTTDVGTKFYYSTDVEYDTDEYED